ncbi:MAG: hypothetical protein FJ147_15985 [Deltaproteobacteria bacterium]|nr:hypothetical protein [Deltaproteobacteria bacterium]
MTAKQRIAHNGIKILLSFLTAVGLAKVPTHGYATTRIGNSDVQLVYEMQQTMQFKGDPTTNAEWVQWRNELRLEYQYEDLVTNRKLLGLYAVLVIRRADFSFLYRGRMDPVYLIRDKYRQLYNDEQTNRFLFPENDIREIHLDMDFGDVFDHALSLRLGKQQIVWGQSALFRSIDMINPLRIDQNGFVGEAFDDFRTPIWAAKFLYDIGTVGAQFSNVKWELFYTPRWRPNTNHLLIEGAWGLQYRTPDLLRDAPDGVNFIHASGINKKYSRVRHPWSLLRVGPNAKTDAPDFGCTNPRCSPHIAGDRFSFVYNIDGSRHQIRGTKWANSMIGTRLLGTAFGNLNFTLNYLFKKADPAAGIEWGAAWDRSALGPNGAGTGVLRSDFPAFLATDHAQRAQWFDVCMKQNKAAFLHGGDAYGYNADGNLNNDRTGTFCLPTFHYYPWTHVFGFTTTYNDSDYTGGVFRLEQSWSTNEPRNFSVRNNSSQLIRNGEGRDEFGNPCPNGGITCPGLRAITKKSKSGTSVWRSMIGFDVQRPLRFLPGTFGTDQWFLTVQHLMTYQNNNRPSALNTFTNAPFDRHQRWEHLLTLSGAGFFARGRLEPLWAYAYSLNAKQHLFLVQFFGEGCTLTISICSQEWRCMPVVVSRPMPHC